jgi:hypothetical protein
MKVVDLELFMDSKEIRMCEKSEGGVSDVRSVAVCTSIDCRKLLLLEGLL